MRMNSLRRVLAVASGLSAMMLTAADPAAEPVRPEPAVTLGRTINRALAAGLVDVHYVLRYDERGDAPEVAGVYCPACDTFHDQDTAALLADKRDLEVTGFLVAPDTVLAPDVMIERSGCEKILVGQGGELVPARLDAYYPEYGGVRLILEKPLPGARPLEFVADAKGPFLGYSRIMENGKWTVRVGAFGDNLHYYLPDGDRVSAAAPGNSLIVTEAGKPAALLLNNNEIMENTPIFQSWKKWPEVEAAAWDAQLDKLRKHLEKSIFPVTLYLREARLSRREKLRRDGDRNELDSMGVWLPDGKFFLPLLLSPTQSSRIERVVIRTPEGDRKAEIVGALRHFGGIELKPEAGFQPLPVAPGVAPLSEWMGRTVWGAKVRVYGRKVAVTAAADVLFGSGNGFRNREFALGLKHDDDGGSNLLFAPDGRLLAIDVGVRAFNYERKFSLLSAAELEKMLADPSAMLPFAQMANRPDDIGFLGVEYQNLNPELAQSEKVAEFTRNGREGLLITYVYPDSPAAQLGLKPGDVLLKVFPDGGAPVVLEGREFANPADRQFPWERLSDIPEMYFEEIPEPWPGVKDPLNQLLTNIGVGNPVSLLVVRDHKPTRLEFRIAAAPDYFEIAPEYQSKALGITVSDITFEVRRYFRMAKTDDGVIVSGVTAGSAASTAGVRPFEIITAVDDQGIRSVGDFEKALQGKNEVRLTVRRLAASRVVTIKLSSGPRR